MAEYTLDFKCYRSYLDLLEGTHKSRAFAQRARRRVSAQISPCPGVVGLRRVRIGVRGRVGVGRKGECLCLPSDRGKILLELLDFSRRCRTDGSIARPAKIEEKSTEFSVDCGNRQDLELLVVGRISCRGFEIFRS